MGLIAAISAAFTWTIACFIWRKQTNHFSAVQINLLKNTIASLIFFPVIFSINWNSDIRYIGILLLSGFIGIALGDSFYISALRVLGTRRTLTVEAFSPILANLFGAIIIGEIPSTKSLAGIVTVTFSLILIANDRTNSVNNNANNDFFIGFIYAFLSIILSLLAAILSRIVLVSSVISPLQATEIRLIGSLLVFLPFIRINFLSRIYDLAIENKLNIIIATILGTNIAILLQQLVFSLLPIGIGWTLLSISPILSLFFARLEGDYLSKKSIVISFIALSGVAITFL